MSESAGSKNQLVKVWSQHSEDQLADMVAEEVPVALVYNDISHAVMMVTPTELEAFALGFSLSEGIVKNPSEIYDIRVTEGASGTEINCTLSNQRFTELKERRRNLTGRTGCGICGAESLQQVRLTATPVSTDFNVTHDSINKAVEQLEAKQPLQKLTGAVHGAAWCNGEGFILELCEDVGRHNALDKLIGVMAYKSMLHPDCLGAGFILVSSRASYEMVQKTAMVNAPAIVAVSAATTMAIEMAAELGITLIGFARKNRHVTYVDCSVSK